VLKTNTDIIHILHWVSQRGHLGVVDQRRYKRSGSGRHVGHWFCETSEQRGTYSIWAANERQSDICLQRVWMTSLPFSNRRLPADVDR